MKHVAILLALFSAVHLTNAQWIQTQGPTGGSVYSLISVRVPGTPAGSVLLAGSSNIYRSTDVGASWKSLPNPVRIGGILSLASIPTEYGRSDSVILCGANGALLRSTDFGATWDVLSSTMSYAHSLLRIPRREPAGHDLLFASAPSDGVYRSSDDGVTWVKLPTGFKYPSGALAADTEYSRNGTIRLFAGVDETTRVYSSTDFGDHWMPGGEGIPNCAIHSLLVIDSSLYAGTETGVYVSTDMGASWMADGAEMPAISVHSLACNSTAGRKQLFAATDNRVYTKSPGLGPWVALGFEQPAPRSFAVWATGEALWVGTDYGVYQSVLTWAAWVPRNNGLTNLQVTDIAFFEQVDGNTDTRMFASTYGGGVFLTEDRGDTWIPVNGGLVDTNVNCLLPDDSSLYAGTSGGGVFRYRPANQNWIAAHNGLPYTDIVSIVRSRGALLAAALGHGVFVSTNEGADWSQSSNGLDNLNVCTLAAEGYTVFAGTSGGGVSQSTDGGVHWANVNNGLGDLDLTRLHISGSRLYAGTHGGVYVSTNWGNSWTSINNGLSDPEIMSFYACDSRLFAGTANGKVFTSSDGGDVWTIQEDCHTSADILAVTATPGPGPEQTDVWACGFGNGITRTRNEWTGLVPSNRGLVNTSVSDIVAKSRISSGPSVLFAASSGVHRSTDGGWTWTSARTGLNGLWVTCLATTPAERNGAVEMLFAGTSDGGVCLSFDDGASWSVAHENVLNSGGYGVTALLFMQRPLAGDGLDIFFAVPGAGVFLSTDAGSSWRAVNTGLPVRSGRILGGYALARIDTVIFAATEEGVYRSPDRGRNWASSSAGIVEKGQTTRLCALGKFLFVSISSLVYRSNDGGATWQNVNAPLTTPTGSEAVYAMTAVGGTLYIATAHGWILMSPDLGAHWKRIDDGEFSSFTIQALFADASSPSVGNRNLLAGTWMYSGTFGGGIWRRPLTEVLPPLTIVPDSISFGGVEVGWHRDDTVWVNNNATSPMVVNAAVQGSGAFDVSPPGATVTAGGTSAFAVTYAPAGEGNHQASLVFTCSALESPDTVRVRGLGIPTDIVTITSVSPQAGPIGDEVRINGRNFSAVSDSNVVRFGGVKALITSAAPSCIVARVPAGAMYRPVTVTRRGRIATGTRPFVVTFQSCGRIDSTSFSKAEVLPPGGTAPVRHVLGDLDGDGKLDVVTWDPDTAVVAVYRNASTPGVLLATSFATPKCFTIGTKPLSVALADLDGDGKLDIVAGPGPSVLRNTSTPGSILEDSFAPPVTFTGAGSEAADVDGDGRLDLVSTWSGGTVKIRMNLGSPGMISSESFGPAVLYSSYGPGDDLSIGDLDGDGKPDIAVAVGQFTGTFVFRNTCERGNITPASFAPCVRFEAGTYTSQVAMVDVDGDAKLDLLSVLRYEDRVGARRNTCVLGEISSTSFAPFSLFPALPYPRRLIPGDLDGDGKPDVIVTLTYVYPLRVQLLHNTAMPGTITDSSFSSSQLVIGTSGQYYDLAVGDIDGDGRPDIVYGTSPASTGGSLAFMRNRMGDTYVIQASADTNGQVIPSGDVSVLHGTTMAFTFAPRPGWGVDSVIVDGTRADSLSSYTFRNTTSQHSLHVFIGPATAVKAPESFIPTVFALEHNYPNPFNPITVVSCRSPVASHIRIVVYDLLGRDVAVLMDEKQEPGRYEVTFDGKNLSSGLYLCRMQAGDFVQTRKLLLIR